MAHAATRLLLTQLRSGSPGWATPRLTTATTYWHGFADWPRPDSAFQDAGTGASLALEFKPPGHPKREYVTGFGQCMTYLRTFEFAAIVLPTLSIDGFEIGQYLVENLKEGFAGSLPIAVFLYDRDPGDAADLRAALALRNRVGDPPPIPKGIGRKIFWGYWRDLSQHDVFAILVELDKLAKGNFDAAYENFWNGYMVTGESLNWEGNPRKKKAAGAPSYSSDRLNARLSLRHMGVIDSTGQLTDTGFDLLRMGKVYGSDSISLLRLLGRLILQAAQHLELIFWVDEEQRRIPAALKQTAGSYYEALDHRLQSAGVIPSVPSGEGKQHFVRDEPKLWNKLGLLVQSGPGRYFHRGEGLVFDWRSVVSMVGD